MPKQPLINDLQSLEGILAGNALKFDALWIYAQPHFCPSKHSDIKSSLSNIEKH